MAGIMNKIGDALHIGGNKDEKKPEGQCAPDHKKEGDHSKSSTDHKPEQKEGIIDKIKDKIHGDGEKSGEKCGEGEKKKKKEKKKKEKKEGHDGHDGSSSSSDSD